MPTQENFLGQLGGVDTLEEGFDPMLNHLQADEAASPEAEKLVATGLTDMMDFAYSEEGLANIVQVIDKPNGELWQTIPEVAIPLLQRTKNTLDEEAEGGEAPPEVYFGDGGLITQVVDLLFDIAAEVQAPGFDDPDQFAAALMGTFKAVGEHIIESGDEVAIEQARSLADDMALTSPSGEQYPPDHFAKKNPVAAGVEQGLLGPQEPGVL
jgi:hypothetical protein